MIRSLCVVLVFGFFGGASALAQSNQDDAASNSVSTTFQNGSSSRMPFEFVNGVIVVTATINGIPDLKLVVDTGIPKSALQDVAASGIRLAKSTETYPLRGIGSDTLYGNRSQDLTIALPGMAISQASLLIVPGSTFVSPMGVQVNGYLGYDILKNYVVKIDYINNTITFTAPQAFNSNAAGMSIPASFDQNRIYVTAVVVNNSVASTPTTFLFDSGCSVGMVLFRQFLQDNPRLVFSNGVDRQMMGVGGSAVAQSVPCTELRLGNVYLQDPYVQILDNGGGGSTLAGLVGNQIWKHFDVTIDFPGKRLFLHENTLLDGTVRFGRPQSY